MCTINQVENTLGEVLETTTQRFIWLHAHSSCERSWCNHPLKLLSRASPPYFYSICWINQLLLGSQSTWGRHLCSNPFILPCTVFPRVILTPSASNSPPLILSLPIPTCLLKLQILWQLCRKHLIENELRNLHFIHLQIKRILHFENCYYKLAISSSLTELQVPLMTGAVIYQPLYQITSSSRSLIDMCWLGPWGAPLSKQKAGKWNSQNNWPNIKNGPQSSKLRWNKQEMMLVSDSELTQHFTNCFWNIYQFCSVGNQVRASWDSKESCHLCAVT